MQLTSFFAFVSLFTFVVCFVKEDQILSLPGWSPRPMPSRQFSGFVDATSDGSIKMHYWFVEAEENPRDAPLLLWFNGGLSAHIIPLL